MRAYAVLAMLTAASALKHRLAALAPVILPRDETRVIESKYIVKMKDGTSPDIVKRAALEISSPPDHIYTDAIKGLAATLSLQEVEKLQHHPNVDYIEPDTSGQLLSVQRDATWGLARISNTKPGSSVYSYDDSAGEGACVYIIDSGIETSHEDFEGRATFAANLVDTNNTDEKGHGTHVAGTVGSKTYGVAKKAKLFAVKVTSRQGETPMYTPTSFAECLRVSVLTYGRSRVIGGMDFVVKDAPTKKDKCPSGIVVNMSLGYPYSKVLNHAANSIARAGLFLVAAAGNSAEDATHYSPPSAEGACTVGATGKNDTIAAVSNFGPAVDVFAPGQEIVSTYPGGRHCWDSGTSMAAPHVAGLAAYLMGKGHKADGLCRYIASTALEGVIHGVPNGTVNLLANNGHNGQTKGTAGRFFHGQQARSETVGLCPTLVFQDGSFGDQPKPQ
ncbi:hypothetical protein QQS21_001485 [Conoideocrella luteorostrata]|uniref:Subtilisin-like protease n=1 Tax=Conoideocrella luteorostrata TaxID=1105319 RepID=A0AAJ0D0M5_9HYPO|nr:hypothetical protein QQS21_001485 [Conoideocrella luteorostrata]